MTLRRLHYFTGRLLGAADLAAEQDYLRERQRRLVRATVGAGVVSGLAVRVGRQAVTVEPGAAVDCQGELLELTDAMVRVVTLPPPDVAPRWVVLTYCETPGGRLPPLVDASPPDPAEAAPEPSWIEESATLSVVTIDPMRAHRRARHRYAPCGAVHGVPLARVHVRAGRWRLDPAWRPSRL